MNSRSYSGNGDPQGAHRCKYDTGETITCLPSGKVKQGEIGTTRHYESKIRSNVLKVLGDDFWVTDGQRFVLGYVGVKVTHVHLSDPIATIQVDGIGSAPVESFPGIQRILKFELFYVFCNSDSSFNC